MKRLCPRASAATGDEGEAVVGAALPEGGGAAMRGKERARCIDAWVNAGERELPSAIWGKE